MAPSKLPVPNSIQSFWRTELHPLDSHRSTPTLPDKVDIAVVGAGYAGASVVYHMLKTCRDKGVAPPSIVILEAREACSGATGRNGGHLKPDPYNRPASLVLSHGVEVAAECAAFEAATLKAVKTVVEEEHIDCDFVLTRAVDALMTDSIHAHMKAGLDRLRQHAHAHAHAAAGTDSNNKLDDGFLQDVFYEGDPAKAQQLSDVKGARACVSYTAGHVWPYKLVMGLLQRAVAAGVNLQTHTPVASVSAAPDAEGYYTVTTTTRDGDRADRSVVRAAQVIYATNGYTSSVLPEFVGRIVPVRGICSRIVVPDDPSKQPAPMLPHSYMMRWSPTEYDYLIPRLDGSIVVGGARSKYYQDLGCWYDCVDDDQLITTGDAHHHFDGYMQKHFRSWERSGAYTDKVWAGIMGYSADNAPFIGAIPGRPNQFIIAGFTGHGMPQVFLSAKGLAAMVVEGADFKSTGIPRVFQVTKERLASDKNAILESWASSAPAQAKI